MQSVIFCAYALVSFTSCKRLVLVMDAVVAVAIEIKRVPKMNKEINASVKTVPDFDLSIFLRFICIHSPYQDQLGMSLSFETY
jgi:hypothetical protein